MTTSSKLLPLIALFAWAGEVLVRVHYASINPIDWKLQKAGRLPMPAIPGADFAGQAIGVTSCKPPM